MNTINKLIINNINKMNKRIFGSNVSSTMNLPHQKKVLEERKQREKKVWVQEKREQKIQKLIKQRNIILEKFKGVKKLQAQSKNYQEKQSYNSLLEQLDEEFKIIFRKINHQQTIQSFYQREIDLGIVPSFRF